MKPSLIIIFGSTGNLTYKKLLPAIYRLKENNLLPDQYKIICIGRKNYTTKEYIEHSINKTENKLDWSKFSDDIKYFRMDMTNLNEYNRLIDFIAEFCGEYENILYYLATAPEFFPIISKGLARSTLVIKGDLSTRVVFEKPFGKDLNSAKEYNNLLLKYFDEEQIYRIDHYLGKEMVQNIMIIRFANRIFEDIWNNRGIKSIKIIAAEAEGVMERGAYYDKSGVLKDMIQNHLIQMLALTTMLPPKVFGVQEIKDSKVEILKNLNSNETPDIIIAQYDGYKESSDIPSDSKNETFIALKFGIDMECWRDVPIYMMSGKALGKKKSEIIIEFKENSHCSKMWSIEDITNNILVIKVQPKEGIYFKLNTKKVGLTTDIEKMDLDYCHVCNGTGNLPEAYEKLILDALSGDQTLFTRWDEIEYSWAFIDKIREYIDESDLTLHPYRSYDGLKDKIINKFGVDINEDY